jgi:hypothetical protein
VDDHRWVKAARLTMNIVRGGAREVATFYDTW